VGRVDSRCKSQCRAFSTFSAGGMASRTHTLVRHRLTLQWKAPLAGRVRSGRAVSVHTAPSHTMVLELESLRLLVHILDNSTTFWPTGTETFRPWLAADCFNKFAMLCTPFNVTSEH